MKCMVIVPFAATSKICIYNLTIKNLTFNCEFRIIAKFQLIDFGLVLTTFNEMAYLVFKSIFHKALILV